MFVEIQAAIAAAQDGDTLLVKSGQYSPFTVDGKALTIVADLGQIVETGNATVPIGLTPNVLKNLPAGKALTLRGLKGAFQIEQCSGFIRLEDCETVGRDGICILSMGIQEPAIPGLVVTQAAAMSLVRCVVNGADAGFELGPFSCCTFAASGLVATAANITLYHCDVSGGKGIHLCGDKPPITQSGSDIRVFDDNSNGPRTLSMSSPLRRGQTGQFDLTTVPGDTVLLLLSVDPGYSFIAPHDGTLLGGPPFNGVFVLGTIQAPTLTLPVIFSQIPSPGIDAFDVQFQAVHIAPSGEAFIGHLTVITTLDPSF